MPGRRRGSPFPWMRTERRGEERTALLVIKRWIYPDLGWGNDEKRKFGVGAGAYGSVVMRLGDSD